jgi:hypothetical protein
MLFDELVHLYYSSVPLKGDLKKNQTNVHIITDVKPIVSVAKQIKF